MPGLREVMEHQAGTYPDKKSLYACGICEAVFDDFALRQEHLLNHQQSGMSKDAWTKDTTMHSLLSYPSISATWNLLVSQTVPYLNPGTLSWNWSNCRATGAMEALEHKRFNNNQELRGILDDVLGTLDERTFDQALFAGVVDDFDWAFI
ncbi:uncharacterized protein LTHEOB_6133 [Lasiodiplodia theobromae]|uniref:uncharacterized protein n=1 Tax=Lasiodiplodia theobromae TaxID=45133 RepID=UPI0015C36050|nr:uncharacterized protein LTHEOB_6133 [Lasiodiplodia theobromae]KAF4544563.1 hypothetical protein LTHEOB_6133 [Lasiodiplodia theobromae]